jgi:hypothetical protein
MVNTDQKSDVPMKSDARFQWNREAALSRGKKVD